MKNRSKYILLSLCIAFAMTNVSAQELNVQSEQDEYLPVAYGVQKKSHQSVSSFTISGEELLKSRASNLMIALQGKLPGLNIMQSSGEPGREAFSMNVRGFDSKIIDGNNEFNNKPIFMIDGVERDPTGIDLHEVESVTVLRDAAATALYGMRGSGGVVLINTKRGINGETQISVTVDHALQAPTTLPDFVSAYDYVNMFNERTVNDGKQVAYTDDEIEHYRTGDNQAYYPTRDVMGDFLKDYTQMTRANINFKGGNDMMRFFTSVGYQHQGGIFENEVFDDYSYDSKVKSDRYNFRTNLDMKVNETLDAWVYIGGFLENKNGSDITPSAVLKKLYETPNNAYNDLTPDGEVVAKLNRLSYLNKQSVYGMLNRTGSSLETETRIGNNVGARQDLSMLTKGLSASGQVAFDVFTRKTLTRSRSYESYELSAVNADSMAYGAIGGTSNSSLGDGLTKSFYYMYNFRGSLDYEREFGDHYVTGLLFGESQIEQQQALLATHFITYGARANYAYQNKYLAELGMSYQGSEQFAKGKRYGFFPSLSLGWIASQESFLQDNEVLSFLKVRASIGQNGNSVFNYGSKNQYQYITSWNTNATENLIGNEDFSWETSTKANVGVEAQLFNALSIGVDLFYHDNTNLITDFTDPDNNVAAGLVPIPSSMSGLNTSALPPANIGYGSNQGFDVTLGYTKAFASGLNVMLSGYVSGSKNVIDYMGELPYPTTGPNAYAYQYKLQGYAIGQQWGYMSDGLFNDQADIDAWADQSAVGNRAPAPGDIRYKDLTGDGIVNELDLAPLGVKNRPTYFYGLNAQLEYKGFDLYMGIAGVADRKVKIGGTGRMSNGDNFTEYMKNAWTADNFISDVYPRLGNLTNNQVTSDFWMEDGAFVRIKNIELGYTLPKAVAKGNLRIYVNAINPLVWHRLPNNDFDPEPASSSSYPIMKALNLGATMRF